MIVVDCSAVVDALTAVAGTEELRAHLAGEELHAPGLVDVEIVSALRGSPAGPAQRDEGRRPPDGLRRPALRRWPSVDALRRRAFQLRDNISAYDAAYVVLAEALDCPLVTRDRRLAGSSGHGARIEVR